MVCGDGSFCVRVASSVEAFCSLSVIVRPAPPSISNFVACVPHCLSHDSTCSRDRLMAVFESWLGSIRGCDETSNVRTSATCVLELALGLMRKYRGGPGM